VHNALESIMSRIRNNLGGELDFARIELAQHGAEVAD